MVATIPLAHQKFEPNKLLYPVLLSEKADGVPVRMDAIADFAISRQGKPVPSVQRLFDTFRRAVQSHPSNIVSITGEIVDRHTFDCILSGTKQPRTPFKYISGHVRRQEVDEDLCMIVFNADTGTDAGWASRIAEARNILRHCHNFVTVDATLTSELAVTAAECEQMQEHLLNALPTAEGLIAQSIGALWVPNSRDPKTYQKIVRDPTLDLKVVGFEEAVAEDGTPKGMVGAVLVEYKGAVVKAGAGKMSHKERIGLWTIYVGKRTYDAATGRTGDQSWPARTNSIAEIKHKKDDSYAALRQATFQRFRDDKDTADA